MPRFSQQVLGALANPQYGMLTGQAIANVAERASQIPANIRAEQQRRAAQAALQTGLQGYATQDPALLQQSAAALAASGSGEQALAMAQAGSEIAATQQAQAALNARRNAIAASAEANGYPEIAKRARQATLHTTLDDIAKDLRSAEFKIKEKMPTAVRVNLARTAGITPAQFKELGLAGVSDDAFNKYISGLEGDMTPMMDSDGNIKAYRESKFGTVYDDNTQSWVNPGDLGLQQAPPSVQKVEQVAQGFQNKVTDLGAERFAELAFDQIPKAQESVMSIDRILPTVDNMYTGSFADIRLQTAKIFKQLGIPMDDLDRITDTEVYRAESAKRVADYIKTLGAGTGLSDKDLTFTLQVVGGDISADSSTLKKILMEYRSASVRKIQGYQKLRANIESKLGTSKDSAFTMALYPDVIVPSMSAPGTITLMSDEEFLQLSPTEQEEYLKEQGL